MSLANGFREGGITLEYRLIRGVLVDWKRRYEESSTDLENLTEAVRSTHNHILLQIGDTLPRNLSIKSDPFTLFIKSEADYLRSLSNYSKRYTEALKDSQGNQTVGLDLPAIWANFKDTPDVDSARLYAINTHRYDVTQTAIRDQAIGQKLDEHITSLDRLLESLTLEDNE